MHSGKPFIIKRLLIFVIFDAYCTYTSLPAQMTLLPFLPAETVFAVSPLEDISSTPSSNSTATYLSVHVSA